MPEALLLDNFAVKVSVSVHPVEPLQDCRKRAYTTQTIVAK